MSTGPSRSRTVVVTGAGGQDGGYLIERLLEEGAQVHAVEPSPTPAATWLDGTTLHGVDLVDTAAVAELFAQVRPVEVYNLAAISSVARSWDDPLLTAQVNGLAVAGLLDAAWQLQRRTGKQVRVLQASSAELFGEPADVPQHEGTTIAPVNPYGAAKAYAHHLVGVYRGRGLHAVAVVLYGHESVRRPATFVTRKITSTVAAIARGRADELVLGNLTARRDWGWAPDYVDAMVRAVRHDEAMDFVLATGEQHTVEDFVRAAFEHVGIRDWRRHVRTDDRFARPVEAAVQVGDAGRAARVLGWTPTVRFPELVHRMVDADLVALDRG